MHCNLTEPLRIYNFGVNIKPSLVEAIKLLYKEGFRPEKKCPPPFGTQHRCKFDRIMDVEILIFKDYVS